MAEPEWSDVCTSDDFHRAVRTLESWFGWQRAWQPEPARLAIDECKELAESLAAHEYEQYRALYPDEDEAPQS